MRRKPLNVVFDEGVLIHAEKLTSQIGNAKSSSSECTINRSEVLRCAMEMGLSAMQSKVDEQIEKGLSPKEFVKLKNIKALLRK